MNKQQSTFGKTNFLIIGIAILIIVVGFILMSGAKTTEEFGFNPAIFDTRRIVIAPVVTTIGFLTVVVGILWKPKDKKED